MLLSIDLNFGLPKHSLIFLPHTMFLEFRVKWELSGHPITSLFLSNPEVSVKRILPVVASKMASGVNSGLSAQPSILPKHVPPGPQPTVCTGGGWVVLVCLSSTLVDSKIKRMYHTIAGPPA